MRENFQRRSFAMSNFQEKIGVRDWFRFSHPFADRKEKYLNNDYECLILGTFPSVASRDYGYFYGNSTNGFWEYLGEIFSENLIDMSKESREDWMDKNRIAIYDVVESYEGLDWYSNDEALYRCGEKHEYCLDFVRGFLQKNENSKIMFTSKKAQDRFEKFIKREIANNVELVYLPSPSRTNRTKTKENKIKEWQDAFKKAGLIK